MTKNWSFSKITDLWQKKLRSVIGSQNHYLNKILDVHPLKKFQFHTNFNISDHIDLASFALFRRGMIMITDSMVFLAFPNSDTIK